jgi:hypothetical protein
MRKIFGILLILFAMQTGISAQCGKNHRELMNKYCKGIYLTHKIIRSDTIGQISFIFNKGTKYGAYLLNPNQDFPSIEIMGKSEIPFSSFSTKFYRSENYIEYIFTAKESGEYIIKTDFGAQKDACVLFALYFISNEKKGN